MPRTTIPGISRIFVARASLMHVYYMHLHAIGRKPFVMHALYEVDAAGGATAYCEQEETPEGVIYKTVLSFCAGPLPELPEDQTMDGPEHYAFVIVAASGKNYAIGTEDAPFPKIKIKEDISTPADGKAGSFYTVEWAGPLIECDAIIPNSSF